MTTHTVRAMPRVFTLTQTPIRVTVAKDSKIAKKIRAIASMYGVDPKDVQLIYSDSKIVVFVIKKNGNILLVKKPAAWFWGSIRELTAVVPNNTRY